MNTLILQHIDETPDSTVSGLLLNGNHLCYIIEDGHRDVKEPGKTRIPAGTYELFPRESGGFWGDYSRRFGHKFVIGFREVPGFKWILIHIGNKIGSTSGCLLCNAEYRKDLDGNYMGVNSTDTYLALYDIFSELFADGKVFLEIDRGAEPEAPVTPDTPVVVTPPVVPETDAPKGCLIQPLVILALLCFGAAMGGL